MMTSELADLAARYRVEPASVLDWLSTGLCTPTPIWYRQPEEGWSAVGDTGGSDSIDHAESVLAQQGFEPVLRITEETTQHPCILLVHRECGVLAQIEGFYWGSDTPLVTGVGIWGTVRVVDFDYFSAARVTAPLVYEHDFSVRSITQRTPESFLATWFALRASVEFVKPWPTPAVKTWLGPSEPGGTTVNGTNAVTDRPDQLGRRFTQHVLTQLPQHVHDLLGPIAAY